MSRIISILTCKSISNYNYRNNVLMYDPNEARRVFGVPNEIGLAHELIHAYHDELLGLNLRNTLISTLENLTVHGTSRGGMIGSSNCFPDYNENDIRDDFGVDSRPRY